MFPGNCVKVGKKWVGMKRGGGGAILDGDLAREEIRIRDELRERDDVGWEEVASAEARVKDRIREVRQGRWRGVLKKGASAAEMWPVVMGAR